MAPAAAAAASGACREGEDRGALEPMTAAALDVFFRDDEAAVRELAARGAFLSPVDGFVAFRFGAEASVEREREYRGAWSRSRPRPWTSSSGTTRERYGSSLRVAPSCRPWMASLPSARR